MAGGISIAMKDTKKVAGKLYKMQDRTEQVLQRTCSDIAERVPGWVRKGVREEYGIKKTDLEKKSAPRVKRTEDAGATFGVNIEFKYKGKAMTPIHFDMKPNELPNLPKARIRATIIKGQRVKFNKRTFLKRVKSGEDKDVIIPFQRESKRNMPIRPIKTVAAPQMIGSEENIPKQKVAEAVNEGVKTRFNHQVDQIKKIIDSI